MWQMPSGQVKAAHSRLGFDNVGWVGADDMNRRKGYNYLTEFSDLLAKKILLATPGNNAYVREAFAAELLRHSGHPNAIRRVAMSAACTKGMSGNLSDAYMVYDKFLVIQNVVEECDDATRFAKPRVGSMPGRGCSWSARDGCGSRTE